MDRSLDDIISAKKPNKGKGKGKGKGGGGGAKRVSVMKKDVSQKFAASTDKKKPETSKVNTESLLNMSLDDVVSKLKVKKGGKGNKDGGGKGKGIQKGSQKGGGQKGGGKRVIQKKVLLGGKGIQRKVLGGGKGGFQQKGGVRFNSGMMNRGGSFVQNGRVKTFLVKKTVSKPGFAAYPQSKGFNKPLSGVRAAAGRKQVFRPSAGKIFGKGAGIGYQQRSQWTGGAQAQVSQQWPTAGFQRLSTSRVPVPPRHTGQQRQTMPFPGNQNQWQNMATGGKGGGQRVPISQVGRKGTGNVAGRRITISNMPTNLQAAEIRDAFKVAGMVQEVEIQGSTAFVVFARPQDAHEAEHQFDGGEINGQVIQVKVG